MQSYSIYIHIPFCHHRCSYCDFNTYDGLESLIPDYIQALCSEIKFISAHFQQNLPVHTVFIGGGTPSLLPLHEAAQMIEVLHQEFEISEGVEFTIEANPESTTVDLLKGLRSLGVNRLSLGMQSANPDELRLLDRQHDTDQTALAVKMAREAGFDNVNLDLIFGLPHQTLGSWQASLEFGLALEPEHFSLYALTIEAKTPLANWVSKGSVNDPDPDLAADMYESASERLEKGGYQQYEISNWAKYVDSQKILSCRHNLQYWRNQPYLGLGAGAHGYAAGFRTENILSPQRYIQKFLLELDDRDYDPQQFPMTPGIFNAEPVDRQQEIRETMIMGLRLTNEGISREAFQTRFDVPLEDIYRSEIDELITQGLLEWSPPQRDRLRLTPEGRLLGNQVFLRFV